MTRKKIIGVCCIAAGLLLGCNGSNSSSSNGSSSNTPITQSPPASSKLASPALYIDTSTAVPVVNGSPTEGVLYVHNTSNTTINGIKFSLYHETTNGLVSRLLLNLGLKNSGIEDDKGFRLLDADNCRSIQAGGSCAVKFITPEVNPGSQGSTVVKMNYTDVENKRVDYHSIVNYQYADISLLNGVNFFGGGLNTVTRNGAVQHVTAYLLGGGKPGTIYNGVYLANPDTGNVEVFNGFLDGIQVAAGQVIPVEFLVRANGNSTVYSNITPQFDSITMQETSTSKSLTSASLTSTSLKAGSPVSMSITPTDTYTLNFSGLYPLKVNFGGSATESVQVVNLGSQDLPAGQLVAISDNSKVTVDNSDCAGKVLKAYAGNVCNIIFTVNNAYAPSSANITYKVGTDVVGSDVLNYQIQGDQYASLSATVSPSYTAIRTESYTPQITYILNYNNVFTNSITVSKNILGSGLSDFTSIGGTCGVTALGNATVLPKNTNGSCSITGQYSSTKIATQNGKAYLSFNLVATVESITSILNVGSKPLTYTVNWQPNVVFTTPAVGVIPNISTNANGYESKSYTFKIQNQGAAAASLESFNLNFVSNTPSGPKPTQLVINNTGIANSCSLKQSLASNESCNINVVYGPIPASESTNESGSYSLQVNYSGGESVYNYSQTANFNYQRRGNDANVTVAVSSSNLSGGTGMTSGTAYVATGANNANQMVILTYTNQSKNYAFSNFLVNTAAPSGLKYISGGTCNTSNVGITLESQASCTIYFMVDKPYLTSAGSAPVTNISFPFPSASWNLNKLAYKSSKPYSADGAYSQVYVNYTQAVITPMITYDTVKGSGLLVLTLTNESGYNTTGINVGTSDTSSWLESAPSVVGNCTGTGALSCQILSTSGINTQEKITYFMPSYLPSGSSITMPISYTIQPGNIYVGIPSYSLINLTK